MSPAIIFAILRSIFAPSTFLSAAKTLLNFFASPVGKYVALGLVLFAAYLAGDIRGRRIEAEKFNIAVSAAKVAAEAKDKQIAEEARRDAEGAIADLQDQKGKSDAKVAELENQLRSRPANAPCLYGPHGQPAGGVRNAPRPHAAGTRNPGPTVLPSAVGKATGQ